MEIRTRGFTERFTEQISSYVSRINHQMKKELSRYTSSRFYGPLVYAVEGGKRIRPLILLLSREAVGNNGPDPWDAAVAVELLHTESIIHDDIIDDEISRRERMAFHVKYGYNASVLTADFVFGMILDIASRYGDAEVARELSSAALRMCEGEFGELKIDPKLHRLAMKEYLELISEKTASLFQTSAKVGAILGGGSKAEIESLGQYGLQLGTAYQIQDDILDWRNEEKIVRAVTSGDASSIDELRTMARGYASKARGSLHKLAEISARHLLEELADFSVSRES